MPDTSGLFPLYLWDLRTQVESQLRCLTKIHQMYEKLPPRGDAARATQLREIEEDLKDVAAANAVIRTLSTEALGVLNKIPG